MAELAAGLEDAIGGRGRLFLIVGEPGVGKTWLAERLADHALERGTRVLWGRCWDGGGAPPFWPWAQLVAALVEGDDDEALAAALGEGAAEIAQVVPDIAQRLGTPAPASAPASPAARFSLFKAVTDCLRRASSAAPLLLVLDDLHAADEPSLLLLEFLARDLHRARLLVVGTWREAGAAGPPGGRVAVGELAREGRLLPLRGLGRDEVGDLIRQLSGAAPTAATVAAVHTATEGNPLFVREVVRLLAAGAAPAPGPAGVPIPGTVRAVIRRRLAPLSADALGVLAAAAVVGRDFDLALLAPACRLPADRVLEGLSQAVAAGVVAEVPGAAGGHRFSHALVREVLYEGLPLPARTELHRRVGEAIEGMHGDGPQAPLAELARHFAEAAAAGEGGKALAYARRAGEQAMGMHAYEQAAAEYRRALRFAGADEAVRCELLLRLGEAQARAGDSPGAEQSCLQAAAASRRLGSPELLARAALGFGASQVAGGLVNRRLIGLLREALDGLGPQDGPLRARLLARLSLELTFSEERALTASLSRQSVEMARRLRDGASLGTALRARWLAVWGPDGLAERLTLEEELLRLARETGDRELELVGRARRAASSLEAGDLEAVQADVAAHARLAEELRMPVHQWTAATMRAMLALLRGAFEQAERLAEEAVSLQPGRPNARFAWLDQLVAIRWEQGRLGEVRQAWRELVEQFPEIGFGRGWLSLAGAELGDRDDARRMLRSIVDQLPRRPRDGLWLPALAMASLVAAQLDDRAAAEGLYPALLPYAGRHVVVSMPQPVAYLGAGSFHLGLLATATARWAEADGHLEAAATAHERLGARPLLARARYEHARMLLRRGRAASHAERAKLNATRAIRAAIANLAAANPALGRHLEATVRTGRYCSYTPDPRAPIAWRP
jgi:tetratricopeptide (TPR) repeat protein